MKFENNRYLIETSAAATELASHDASFKSALDDGQKDLEMFIKYLQGFYYGALLGPDMVETKNTASETEYEFSYEYKGIKCRNTYAFHNEIITRTLICQTSSNEYDVQIDYSFLEKDGIHYLKAFKSDNRHHGFLFNYYIRYKSLNRMQVPAEFIVEVKSGINTTRFIYRVFNQRVDAAHK